MDIQEFAVSMSCLDKNTEAILLNIKHDPHEFTKLIDNFEQQKEVINVLNVLPNEFVEATSSSNGG